MPPQFETHLPQPLGGKMLEDVFLVQDICICQCPACFQTMWPALLNYNTAFYKSFHFMLNNMFEGPSRAEIVSV